MDTQIFGIELPTDGIYKLPSLGFKHIPQNHGFMSKLLFVPDKARVRIEAAAKALPEPLVPRVKGVHPPEAFEKSKPLFKAPPKVTQASQTTPDPQASQASATQAAQASTTQASASKAPAPSMPKEPKADPPMRPPSTEASL